MRSVAPNLLLHSNALAAWKQNGEKWLQTYFIAKAPNPKINPNYHTHSVCVPTKILMDCLIDAMEIKF